MKKSRARGRGGWGGSIEGDDDRSDPGENEKDQGFENHSPPGQRTGDFALVVVFSHSLRITAGAKRFLQVGLNRH